MKKLILAEKPSVARDIGRILNANEKKKNYLEGKKLCYNLGFRTFTRFKNARRFKQEVGEVAIRNITNAT